MTQELLYDLFYCKDDLALNWELTTKAIQKKHGKEVTQAQLKKAYKEEKETFQVVIEDWKLKNFAKLNRTQKTNALLRKENKILAEQWNTREDLLDSLLEVATKLNSRKKTLPKKKPANGKKSMTKELLLSDLHFGKKTETYNLATLRARLQHLTSVFIREIKDSSKNFSVDRIVIACLGDVIESATMHGMESMRGAEFGNPKQVTEAIFSLFDDVLEPVAQLGIPVTFVGITGNHDRTQLKKTYHNPGEENETYVIYKMLENFCTIAGYSNITFVIPKEAFACIQIYKDNVLYEHYDLVKGLNRPTLEKHMLQRSRQLKKVLAFMRGGHYHEATMYGRGLIIVNGSPVTDDPYSKGLGFTCEPVQTINSYVENKNRPNSFYKYFPVYLP